jgi:hypothetical protein
MVTSNDSAATWNGGVIMNDSDRPVPRSLAMVVTDAQGGVHVTWWEAPSATDTGALGGVVWYAKSTDGGATFSRNVRVNAMPDANYEDPVIAVSQDGQLVYIVYSRTLNGNPDVNDVAVAYSLGGAAFVTPVAANDDAPCATHFLPTSAIDTAGNLLVAWYDNRYGDGRVMWSRAPRPTTATSPLTFAPNGQITDGTFQFTTSRVQFNLGDYFTILVAGGQVYASWTDTRNAGAAGTNTVSQIWVAQGPVP